MKGKLLSAIMVLLAAVLTIGLLSGMASVPAKQQQQQPINETTDSETVPNQVDLYFPSNPTTGYDWEATAEDPDLVEIRDQFFEYKNELNLAGVGGTHWFHLAGVKPGTTSVTFRYLRSWDPDSKISETLYRITIDEQLNVWIWGVEVSDLD